MKTLSSYKNAKKWIFTSICFFLIATTEIGCSAPQQVSTTNINLGTFSFSRTEGQTHKYFSSRLSVRGGNYISDLQILSVKGLPPGIVFNRARGIIEGTPTKAGFYMVTTRFNDKYKGTPKYGLVGEFTDNTEIRIYDKLN